MKCLKFSTKEHIVANPQISIDDDEIAALLDELEQEQKKVASAMPVPAPIPIPPVAPPPPIVEMPEPEPEPEIEPAPMIREPEPEPAIAVLPRGKVTVVESQLAPASVAVAVAEEAVPHDEEPSPVEPPSEKSGAKLNFYVDVNAFNRETKLTEATLDNAMMEQSGLRAYYGSQAAQAEAQHARLKVRFEVLEAKLYDEHRKVLAASGEKVTEKMVENAVKLDGRWLKAKNTVIEAETVAAINKSLVGSLADRRDMMIQLGADRREEFKGATRVLEAQGERENLASRAKAAFRNGVQ